MKCYLRGLLYSKEVAALQKSLSSCSTFVPWDVEIRPCTSGSSNEWQQRASRSTELQFPPSITSISRSLFANSRALAKSFSSVVFLIRLSRQFGLTGRKAPWHSAISSRYIRMEKLGQLFHVLMAGACKNHQKNIMVILPYWNLFDIFFITLQEHFVCGFRHELSQTVISWRHSPFEIVDHLNISTKLFTI